MLLNMTPHNQTKVRFVVLLNLIEPAVLCSPQSFSLFQASTSVPLGILLIQKLSLSTASILNPLFVTLIPAMFLS